MTNITVNIKTPTPITVDVGSNVTVQSNDKDVVVSSVNQSVEANNEQKNVTVSLTNIPSKDNFIIEQFTATVGQTIIIFAHIFRANSLQVFKNGILQGRTVDYTEGTARDKITFSVALDLGDKIDCQYVIS